MPLVAARVGHDEFFDGDDTHLTRTGARAHLGMLNAVVNA